MSQFVEKIKSCVEHTSRDQGIKGLIKLQAEAPENMKFKCRLACLHLMQMNHDWEGIKKLMGEWKLVKNFGKQLVIRMRKRVGEQPGSINDDPDIITKQLDRLNQKNWRLFSPKKNFPDYTQYLVQNSKKDNSNKVPIKLQQTKKQIKEVEQKPRQSNIQGSSIFSKLAQFQKNDKIKDKQINTRGVFSRQLYKNQSTQSLQQKKKQQKVSLDKDKQKRHPIITQAKPHIQPPKKPQKQSNINQIKNTQSAPRPITPSKQQPKKIISLRYGNQKQKPKQQFKDQFSFSAVKAKQQVQGFNQKQTKGQDLDNSFLNFTNQSRIIKDKNEIIASEKKGNILQEIKLQQQQPFVMSQTRYSQVKPLFTQQQIDLIQPNIPPKNYIKNILKAQGLGAVQMLRKQLLL